MRVQRVFLAAFLVAGGPALAGTTVAHPSGPYPANTLPTDQPDTVPHTLTEALGIAYETNPVLTGERAKVRATDENVPAALAGWRPTVSLAATGGWAVGRFESPAQCGPQTAFNNSFMPVPTSSAYEAACYNNGIATPNSAKYYNPNASFTDAMKNNRNTDTQSVSVNQYLYRGGKTTATVHQATNQVFAERANLIASEETALGDTVNAYVTYVEDEQLLALNRQNEQVLGDELRAVNDRFRVGELTRTDVAQAEAALAAAIAQRQTAEGNLQTAGATFYREVGVNPPADLVDPAPLKLPVASEKEAADLAARNNPTVIADLFTEAAAKDTIDVQFAALAPNLFFQAQAFRQVGTSINKEDSYGAQATFNINIPIYQGGSEYAAIRQARQNYQQAVRATQDARRQAVELAVQSWDTLIAARASTASSRIAVRSAAIAVEGTERQALVGSATTQEVLIQQQNLLSAEVTLVQSVTSVVTASYGVASAVGRLTARDLGLAVPLYDETAYYNAVRNRLWGTGDYAVQQPGR
jgi:outer membrane protein